MIPEPIDIKNSFLTSLNDCRALFRHCLTPRGLHTDYGVESAFLQFHKAWETFLEDSMLCFLCGQQPISGQPVTPRFIVSDFEVARTIFYQGQPYKEWTNKDDILKRYSIFFETQTIDQIETNRLITAIRPISSTIKEIIDIRNVIAHSSFAAQNKIKIKPVKSNRGLKMVICAPILAENKLVKRCVTIQKASFKLLARKKIQAKQTRIKVMATCRNVKTGLSHQCKPVSIFSTNSSAQLLITI